MGVGLPGGHLGLSALSRGERMDGVDGVDGVDGGVGQLPLVLTDNTRAAILFRFLHLD